MAGDFEPEQKRYLEGFMAGLQIAKAARAPARPGNGAGGPLSVAAESSADAEPSGPDAAHIKAQDRLIKQVRT